MNDVLARITEGASRDHGVLPNHFLRRAIEAGIVASADGSAVPESNIQPASLDLRLGDVAYPLRCSFLPDRSTVEERLAEVSTGADPISLVGDGAVLERSRPYLVPLQETVRLPEGLRGRTNPKSSTGRADVFTRVITDRSSSFDDIPLQFEGGLYLEIVPLSFPVRVKAGLCLNQLRLAVGKARVDDDELLRIHQRTPLLYESRGIVSDERLRVSDGLFLGLNLRPTKKPRQVGWVAKKTAPVLDLTKVRTLDRDLYWDPVMTDGPNDRIVLQPRDFYLLMSNEGVVIPPTMAAEMTAYDPTSGELRTHYAGFFDPGFGFDSATGLHGSTAALEVRAHDVPFMIEHRQRVCKLTFEHMMAEPDVLYGSGLQSNYQGQTDTLGKHFKLPDAPTPRSRPAAEPSMFDLDVDRADADV
jgi:dCTP deaminase